MAEDFLKVLNEIAKKDIVWLTPDDIAFLKARRDYLTPEQLEKFKEILSEVKEEKKTKSKKSK